MPSSSPSFRKFLKDVSASALMAFGSMPLNMFGGIIKHLGQVEVTSRKGNIFLTVANSDIAAKAKLGDSVAVDGVCLTVVGAGRRRIKFEIIPQTWRLTRFKNLKKGQSVNLERPLRLNDSLDGHLLTGHVDGLGKVKGFSRQGNERILEIIPPPDLLKYIVLRGSIAINGVSLTASHLNKKSFKVSLVEHTLKQTNIGQLKKNDWVNLEIDLIARYIWAAAGDQMPADGPAARPAWN